jgi:hypothetical protein
VEAQVEALLATADEDTSVNFRPCDVTKETQTLTLGKAYGFDGIPNECLWDLPRRTLVHLAHLFNHCLQLGHFAAPLKEAKIMTLPKPTKDPKCIQNLCLISILSTTCKIFGKLILRTTQKHTEERNLLIACQFGFQVDHSTHFYV